MIDKHPEESPKIKEVISRFGRQGGQGEKGYRKPTPKKNTPEALAALAAGAKAEKDSNDWQPNEEEIIW